MTGLIRNYYSIFRIMKEMGCNLWQNIIIKIKGRYMARSEMKNIDILQTRQHCFQKKWINIILI